MKIFSAFALPIDEDVTIELRDVQIPSLPIELPSTYPEQFLEYIDTVFLINKVQIVYPPKLVHHICGGLPFVTGQSSVDALGRSKKFIRQRFQFPRIDGQGRAHIFAIGPLGNPEGKYRCSTCWIA
ncbi:hypothetical protein [Sphingobium sp. HWE2-09]|uniref:hypothetical protein n=1 Tax=Sphingobium sp. HWE2-09 TaxID=3108390 RepID=UPI002DD337CF|nr:hypothetical protein [Sphingobium sp. HWE2-09]